MYWYTLLLAHVFVFYLVGWIPLSFILGHFRLIVPRHRNHTQLYVVVMLRSWLSLIPYSLIVLGLGWSPQIVGLQFPTQAVFVILGIIISLLICGGLVLLWHVLVHSFFEVRAYVCQPSRSPVPETAQTRVLFIPFALTLALVEEVLYRGFLLAYLTRIFPSVPMFLAIFIAAFLFGIGHLQQRTAGVFGGVLLGLVFGWLYASTGSLIPSMIIHSIFNLRLLFLWQHSSAFPED